MFNGGKCLTIVPSLSLPPNKFHALAVVSQYILTYGECDNPISLKTPAPLPDIFEATMCLVLDDLQPPRQGIRGNAETRISSVSQPFYWNTKLLRFSRLNLGSVSSMCRYGLGESGKETLYTHPPYGISNPKRFNFPLQIVSYMNHRPLKCTYESSFPRKSCGGSTTDFS